jgi:hypothetical protein
MKIQSLIIGSFLTLTLGTSAKAQMGQDFPDYRPKKDNFSKVAEKDIHDDLIYFTLAGLDFRVGKNAAPSMPLTGYGADNIQFSDQDGNKVIIKSGTFTPAKHKLYYIEKHLIRIDGHPYFGDYGLVPSTTIQSVTYIHGKDTVQVPGPAFSDLYEPVFTYGGGNNTQTHDGVYFSADKHTVYIYMLNKEANNGYYEVTWVIRDGKYLRRVVDNNI